MDLFDRIYCLDRVLRQSRYPVPHAVLQEKLECSRATINRIIRGMRDFLARRSRNRMGSNCMGSCYMYMGSPGPQCVLLS